MLTIFASPVLSNNYNCIHGAFCCFDACFLSVLNSLSCGKCTFNIAKMFDDKKQDYSNFFDKPFLCLTGNIPGVGLVQLLQQATTCAKIYQKKTTLAYGAYMTQ